MTRFSNSARVVMGKDYRSSVRPERGLDDFTGIDARLCKRAAKEFFAGYYSMLRIQQQDYEHFVLPVMQKQPEVVAYRSWRSKCIARSEFFA